MQKHRRDSCASVQRSRRAWSKHSRHTIRRTARLRWQLCSALCPASKTKVFYGSTIDSASAEDGERYANLPTAFAYRQRISADCTCNGRDIFGLARMDAAADPTLRAGDMIQTANGPQVFNGTAQARNRSLPMQLHSAASDTRRRLSTTGAAPAE